MEGKDAIINSIIAAAESKARAIVDDAIAEKDALLETTRNRLKDRETEALAKAEKEAQKTVERKVTLANLDRRKLVLKAKQALIDKVYDAAIVKTLNMTDNVYREFIGGLVARYADDGDEIMVSERDIRRLPYDWATKLGESIGKDLSLSSKHHTLRGGVVLVGYKCDKNLTLDTLVKQIRPETESEICEKLFSR
ncbi:MAG: hypothetical protein HFK09_03370 [Clostridia bacterium]|nr:hypothetical protein [Clostridia bacterium]